MAIYKLTSKVGSVSYAKAHAGYILRENGYEGKEDLVYKESGNMEWMTDGSSALDFWSAADENERVNGTTYREYELTIPNELSHKQAIETVKSFAEKELGKNHPYTFAIHESYGENNQKNLHCHFMFSERKLDGIERNSKHFFKQAYTKNPTLGGAKKEVSWRSKEKLINIRKSWEVEVNQALEKAGRDERVDCRSLKNQRIEALEKGDLDKAEMLDRQAINIDGKILQQQKRLGEDSLTEFQKMKLEKHKETKRVKTKKEKEYEVKKGLRVPTEQECIAKLKELGRNNNLQERALNMCSRGNFLRTQKEINHIDTLILISPEAQGLRKDKEDLEKKIEELKLIATTNQYAIVLRGLEKDYEKEKLVYEEAYKSYGKSFESEKKAIEESKEEKTLDKFVTKYSKSENLFKDREKLLEVDPIEKARNILTQYQLQGTTVNIAVTEQEKEKLASELMVANMLHKELIPELKLKISENEKLLENNYTKFELLNKELDKQSDKVEMLARKIASDTSLELKAIDRVMESKGIDFKTSKMSPEDSIKLLATNGKQKELYDYYSKNNLDGKYNKQLFETRMNIQVSDKLLKNNEQELLKEPKILKEMMEKSQENMRKSSEKIEKYEKVIAIFDNKLDPKKMSNGCSYVETLAINNISKGEYNKVFQESKKVSENLERKEREYSETGSFSIFKRNSLSKEIEDLKNTKRQLEKNKDEIIKRVKSTGNLGIVSDKIQLSLEKAKTNIGNLITKEKTEKNKEWRVFSILRDFSKDGKLKTYQPIQQQKGLGIMKTINQLKNAITPVKNNGQNNLGIKLQKEKENEGWEL